MSRTGEPNMSTKDMVWKWRQRPFMPFRLVTSDGSTYDVLSPEWMIVDRSCTHLAIPSLEDPDLPDHVITIATHHITHTWPLEAVRERELAVDPGSIGPESAPSDK